MTSKEFIFLQKKQECICTPSPPPVKLGSEPSNIDTCQKPHHSLLPFHSATVKHVVLLFENEKKLYCFS